MSLTPVFQMKKTFTSLLLAALSWSALAQYQHPVAFEIGDEKITTAEFKSEFLKSIGKSEDAPSTACTYEKRKALEDYADLYLNYRVKLKDAYEQGMDKDEHMLFELAHYRNELSAPYMIDSASMSQLMHEAYDRNHYAIHAYHILIPCSFMSAEDTLEAYNKAMKVYQRVTTGKEDFSDVSRELSAKEIANDPEAKRSNTKPYDGDLGFFTVFDMVYPFENCAYGLKEGEVSKPVRTRYGYHVVKIAERVPYYGRSSVQHIWISDKQDEEQARNKIYEAYEKIKGGEQFAVVCRNYSDDRSTADNGGLIPPSPLRQLPTEYIAPISRLKEGHYSEPFHTKFGWHIIYCISKEQQPTFESLLPKYQQQLSHDATRGAKSKKVFIQQSMHKYNCRQLINEYDTIGKGRNAKIIAKADLAEAASYFNDSSLRKEWRYVPRDDKHDMRPILTIDGRSYTNDDLLKYIAKNPTLLVKCVPEQYVKVRYKDFVEDMAKEAADRNLEKEHPDFAALMNEYRNGLIIFAYNDKMIWGKAIEDSIGLMDYYNRESEKKSNDNPSDSVYFWNLRAKVISVYVPDSTCLPADKAIKVINKQLKNGIDSTKLVASLQKKLSKKCTAEQPLQLQYRLVEQGNQDLLSIGEWHEGIFRHSTNTGYRLLVVTKTIEPTLKTLREGRGYYMSDYQNYLEQQLVQHLKEKYHVVKHQDAINEITY